MKQLRSLTFRLLLLIIATAFLCSTTFATDPPTHTGERSLEEFLTENGSFQNPDGYSGTLNPAGFSLTLNEDGTPVFVDNSSGDPNDNWNTVGEDELSAVVSALFVHNNILYVGGGFSSVGGITASRIARYKINTQTWRSLGDGVDGFVNCFAILGNFLYVGGGFWQAGGKSAHHIARYNLKEDDGNSSWSGFGNVYRKTEYENDWFQRINVIIINENTLVVGGRFTSVSGQGYSTNGSAVNSIARFDTITETWSSFGDGVEFNYDEYGRIDGDVNGLAIIDDYLYASGYSFEYAGGKEVNNIARYDLREDNGNSSWSALPGEDPGRVKGMIAKEDNLVIAGSFENYGDLGSDNIGLYNTGK